MLSMSVSSWRGRGSTRCNIFDTPLRGAATSGSLQNQLYLKDPHQDLWQAASSMRDLEYFAISMRFQERVIGCFKSLATGDAIGKQTEMLSRVDVQQWYPGAITGFHSQPGEVIPRYSGKRYEWRIGETTDDTEQTLAVTRALLREGRVSHKGIGRGLRHCKKSLHPGVSLWTFVQSGDPSRIASEGDGCGAAMRTAPIGVFHPSSRQYFPNTPQNTSVPRVELL